ncbi:MAG: hypothetical protein EBU75_08655 [Betaproteobacteria bacterium]|nr:hypothetical protein [Betaproteobacteria bacterium]
MKYAARIIVGSLTFTSLHSNAQIFAESGSDGGKESVVLLTTPCKGDAGKAGYKMATRRLNGSVIDGCYFENNRQNFIFKWQDGTVDEVPKSNFNFSVKKTLIKDAPPAKTEKFATYSCDYQNLSENIVLSGPCHKQEKHFSGKFGYILTWPSGSKISIEYIKSQSGHHIWKMNGKSAVAVELDREHLRGFTTDLNQFIEWQDRPNN